MIVFRPFAPVHLESLDLAALQPELQSRLLEPGLAQGLVVGGLAYSGFAPAPSHRPSGVEAGALEPCGWQCVGCAGVLPQWEGRALAWSIFGAIAKPHWLAVTRQARRILERAQRRGFRRIEAHVDAQFPEAIRFARLLGFEVEALMRRFGPTGRDTFLYVRFDDG